MDVLMPVSTIVFVSVSINFLRSGSRAAGPLQKTWPFSFSFHSDEFGTPADFQNTLAAAHRSSSFTPSSSKLFEAELLVARPEAKSKRL
jgi:hypothetical protein